MISGLKNKKIKDMSLWKNEYIKAGGAEMVKSIEKIMNHVERMRHMTNGRTK